MTPTSEFMVNGIVAGASGLTHVIGRCGDTALRVGDIFETLEDESGSCRSVRVEIVVIHAYGHDLEELGAGMTARLSLSGSGVEQLTPSCVLVTAAINPSSETPHAPASRHA